MTPEPLLNSFEQFFLNLADELGPEAIDPMIAMRMSSIVRGMMDTVYQMGRADAQEKSCC